MIAMIVPSVRETRTVASDQSTGELAVLELDGRRLLLPIKAIVAVLDPAEMTRKSGHDVAPWIGTLASRGGTIPVADGRQVFGLPTDTPIGKILVLQGQPLYGLAVSDLAGSIPGAASDVFPLPMHCGSRTRLLQNAAVWNGDEMLLRIDPTMLHRWLSDQSNEDLDVTPMTARSTVGTFDGHGERVLVVGMGGELCALPLIWVRQISKFRTPVPLLRSHPAIAGLVSWERAPLPVIDLWSLRMSTPMAGSEAMLVVIGAPAETGRTRERPIAALLVGSVMGVVSDAERRDDAVFLTDGRHATLLDMDSTLAPFSTE